MQGESEIRTQICEIGKRMYNRNMAAANDGNISVKLCDKEWLCTPAGHSKGFMSPDMICKVDEKGEPLTANGSYRPSSEIKMHLRVYEKRNDINAVVHAHPAYATSFATVGIPLTQPILPEAIVLLGCVPIVKYGVPSTTELPDNIEEYLDNFDAVLLESHGALSWGKDLKTAYHIMESLEFYAQMLYQTKLLGGAKVLDQSQVDRLHELRKELGLPGRHPANLCVDKSGPSCHQCART